MRTAKGGDRICMKKTNRWKMYRASLFVVLGVSIFTIMMIMYLDILKKTPSVIRIKSGMAQDINLNVPLIGVVYPEVVQVAGQGIAQTKESLKINLEDSVTFFANEESSYIAKVKLFGLIPFKDIKIQVIDDIKLIPAGIPIGIYVKTQGVLVIDTGKFMSDDGIDCEPAVNRLKKGDYIIQVNGQLIEGKRDFIEKIEQTNGKETTLTINRKDEFYEVKVKPEKNQQGLYKIGVWIRDSAQGVGTMTFVDMNNQFGALGHGINDVDTAKIMKLSTGNVYETEIVSITKGKEGKPGELSGIIRYTKENIVGDISVNSPEGIYGICNEKIANKLLMQPLSIGLMNEIEIGKAQIFCSLGDEPKFYDILITNVDHNKKNTNRSITVKVIDEELITKTGGIVQGMSGSPIIQNDKLVGAITHVLVKDATKGYGIAIEKMLTFTQ